MAEFKGDNRPRPVPKVRCALYRNHTSRCFPTLSYCTETMKTTVTDARTDAEFLSFIEWVLKHVKGRGKLSKSARKRRKTWKKLKLTKKEQFVSSSDDTDSTSSPTSNDQPPSTTEPRVDHLPLPIPCLGSTNPLSGELVALDCEMVGTCTGSALAQCSILSYNGEKLFHAYVRPSRPIIHYRTKWSGIRPWHMKWAVPHDKAVAEIRKILEGKILIGHDLTHDLTVIGITWPKDRVRDTVFFKPLRTLAGLEFNQNPSLKKLSRRLLGREIQAGCHNSLEDATAALDLYRKHERLWESSLVEQKWDKTVWLQDCYWPHEITAQ